MSIGMRTQCKLERTRPLCCETVAFAPPLSPQETLIESPLTGNASELSFFKMDSEQIEG